MYVKILKEQDFRPAFSGCGLFSDASFVKYWMLFRDLFSDDTMRIGCLNVGQASLDHVKLFHIEELIPYRSAFVCGHATFRNL